MLRFYAFCVGDSLSIVLWIYRLKWHCGHHKHQYELTILGTNIPHYCLLGVIVCWNLDALVLQIITQTCHHHCRKFHRGTRRRKITKTKNWFNAAHCVELIELYGIQPICAAKLLICLPKIICKQVRQSMRKTCIFYTFWRELNVWTSQFAQQFSKWHKAN